MKKVQIGGATLYQSRMEEVVPSIRFDHIFTDPPYLYIKTHDFDKPFDEPLLFENTRRILPDNGFIALFGRGTSFYRWNTRLAELGFVFKEEIVWEKRYTTAPCMALSRVHETVSIHTKKAEKIRRVKVPYIEQKQHDIESIINDVKAIKRAINNEAGLNNIIEFLRGGELYNKPRADGHCITHRPGIKDADRNLKTVNSIVNGMNEKTIMDAIPVRFGLVHPPPKSPSAWPSASSPSYQTRATLFTTPSWVQAVSAQLVSIRAVNISVLKPFPNTSQPLVNG